jgi:ABC-2 type transport system ATP-binding protein
VDPLSRRRFWNLIYELAGRGVTVFVTTHYMDEAEYCDRIGLIYRGELIALGSPETLKQEAMTEDVLECFPDRPQEALEIISALPGVKEAALFGRGLHVVVERGQPLAEFIRDRLQEAGFRTPAPEKIAPSLEDVFVSLIEARDRAEKAPGEFRQ